MLLYSQMKAFQQTQDELPLDITLGGGGGEDSEGAEDGITGEEFLERLLDFCTSNLAADPREKFTLSDFASKFKLKMDDSLRLLLFGHDKYKVRINYEVHCPEVSCHNIASSTSYREDIPDSQIECPTCNHTFTPTDDDVWITFSVI